MNFTKNLQQRRFLALSMGSALLLGLGACGADSSSAVSPDDDSNGVEISGSFNSTNLLMKNAKGTVGTMSTSLEELALVCSTLSIPAQTGIGAVSSTGEFSVTIPDAQGKKLACYVALASDTDEVLATMVFEDESEKNINGDNKKDTSHSVGGKATLGIVALDLNSGSATVNVANIEDTAAVTEVAGAGAWNVTGTWEFSKVPASEVPKGYQPICEGETNKDGEDCHGPGEGMKIFFQLVDGVKVSDATKPAYGMMMWQGSAESETAGLDAYNTCSGGGSNKKLGVDFADLIANGVNFTDNTAGVTEGSFIWSTLVTVENSDTIQNPSDGTPQDLDEGWKLKFAKTGWPIQTGCSQIDLRGKSVWRCVDKQGTAADATDDVYSFGLGGGCVITGTTTPVFLDDWNQFRRSVELPEEFPVCSNEPPAAPFADFSGFSCAGVYDSDGFGSGDAGVNVTCSNANGFSRQATPGLTGDIDNDLSSSFEWNRVGQIEEGTLCSSIATGASADELKLAQLKCYADAFYSSGLDNNPSVCVPRLRTNWAATTSEAFLLGNMDKPSAQVFANFVSFDSDGVLSMFNEEDDYQGVQAGEYEWTDCHVRSYGTISLNPKNKSGTEVTEVRAGYSETQVLIDNSKPACVGYFKDQDGTQNSAGAWSKVENFIFDMTKQ